MWTYFIMVTHKFSRLVDPFRKKSPVDHWEVATKMHESGRRPVNQKK